MAGDALKSIAKVDGDKVDVRTGELRTVLNCAKPKIVAGIIGILHSEIIELKDKVALQIEKGAGYIRDGEDDANDACADGYEAGLRAFAWWKDGVQYVGTRGRTLADAIKKGERDA